LHFYLSGVTIKLFFHWLKSMSAGRFVFSFYDADYGAGTAIHPVRVQEETLDATVVGTAETNTPVGTAATNPISASVSDSTRALGLHARLVYMELAAGATPPATYKEGSRVKIPALSKDFYAAAAAGNQQVTYLGTTWRVTGTRAEKTR
jgi:hypothetical protein